MKLIIYEGGLRMTASNDPHKKFRKELNSGTSSLVLLSVMANAVEPMYGYQIAKDIEGQNNNAPMMKQGALYPVLRSLEAAELLTSHVNPSVSGPPRRYYEITDTGRKTLEEWKEIWDSTQKFIDKILGGNDVQY